MLTYLQLFKFLRFIYIYIYMSLQGQCGEFPLSHFVKEFLSIAFGFDFGYFMVITVIDSNK